MFWRRKPTDRSVRAVLSQTVGPAPWYWKTFPPLQAAEQSLYWQENPMADGGAHSVFLRSREEEGSVFLSIDMYARVFNLPPDLLGIWFERGRQIHLSVIDPAALKGFSLRRDLSGRRPGFMCEDSAVIGEHWLSTDIEQGEHRIDLPAAFAGLESLMLIGQYERVQEAACSAIFEIVPGTAPGSRRLRVLPQRWFNREDYDLDYQWITRVARDPVIGRIVGDGIRISPFVLTEDGCHIDRWLR